MLPLAVLLALGALEPTAVTVPVVEVVAVRECAPEGAVGALPRALPVAPSAVPEVLGDAMDGAETVTGALPDAAAVACAVAVRGSVGIVVPVGAPTLGVAAATLPLATRDEEAPVEAVLLPVAGTEAEAEPESEGAEAVAQGEDCAEGVGNVEGGAVGVSTEEAVGCAEGEDGADCAASALMAAGALPLAAEEAELARDALVGADAVGAAFAVGAGEALGNAVGAAPTVGATEALGSVVPVVRTPVAEGGSDAAAGALGEGGADGAALSVSAVVTVAAAEKEGSGGAERAGDGEAAFDGEAEAEPAVVAVGTFMLAVGGAERPAVPEPSGVAEPLTAAEGELASEVEGAPVGEGCASLGEGVPVDAPDAVTTRLSRALPLSAEEGTTVGEGALLRVAPLLGDAGGVSVAAAAEPVGAAPLPEAPADGDTAAEAERLCVPEAAEETRVEGDTPPLVVPLLDAEPSTETVTAVEAEAPPLALATPLAVAN